MSNLTSLVMVTLNARTWTARKLDKKATKEVKDANGISSDVDAGNFNKRLLESPEHQACNSHIGAVRNEFYLKAAPWGDSRGEGVVKAEDVLDLMSWFGDQKAALEPKLDAFGKVYDAQVAARQYETHGLHDPKDFPPWSVVREKYGLHLSVRPLPKQEDIRVLTEIPQHIREEIEEALTKEFKDTQTQAVKNALEPLFEKVEHMVARLKEYKGEKGERLHASLIENVEIMAGAARRLNISRDPVVEQMADMAVALVTGVTQEDLKGSPLLRSEKATQAEDLAARMAKLFE